MDSISASKPVATNIAAQAPVEKKEAAATHEPKDSFKKSATFGQKLWKGTKSTMKFLGAGFGTGSGAVGGGLTVGVLSGTGGAITALATGAAVAALATTAGTVGGIAGAIVFGVAGMMGGYSLAEKLGNLMESAYHKFKG